MMKLRNKTLNQEFKTKLQDLFGTNFVFQALAVILFDPIYLKTIRSKVKPEYFDTSEFATEDFARFMCECADAGTTYTKETILLKSKEDASGDEVKLTKYGVTWKRINETVIDDPDAIKKTLENQIIKARVLELADDMCDKVFWERYQENPTLLLKWGFKFFLDELNFGLDDFGTDAENDIDEALAEDTLEWVPTGEDMIDKLTGGGAPKKSVAGFIAPTGFGKSTISAMLGFEMAKRGFKVLHIFFEDEKPMIWRKYYSRMTGIPIKEIQGEETKNIIINHPDYFNVKKNVRLVKRYSGENTVEDIEQLMMSNVYDGFEPDVIIIDYFDCLKMSTNPIKDKLLAEEQAMRKLENLSHKRNILIWAMMQANRMATSKGNTDGTAQNIEGSKKKKNIAATVIALGKDMENPGYYTFEVDKSRNNGNECVIHRVKFIPGEVRFDWSEMDIEYRNVTNKEYQPLPFDEDLACDEAREPQIPVYNKLYLDKND